MPIAGLGLTEGDFQAYLDRTTDPVLAHRGGIIVYVNDAFVRAMHASGPQALVGRPLVDIIAPEDRARVDSQIRELAPRVSRPAADMRALRADGVVVTFEYAVSRIGDPERPVAIVHCREVTAQRAQAEALRRAESEFRLVFENSPIGMAMTSLEGRYLHTNYALSAILRYSEDELREMTFTDVTHPDDRGRDSERMRLLKETGRSLSGARKRYVRRDGVAVDASLGLSLVRDAEGNPIGYISHIIDITAELQAAEAQLRVERALHESEALHRQLVRNLPNVAVFLFDHELRYRLAQGDALLSGLGLTAASLLGKRVSEIGGLDMAERIESIYQRALAGESIRWEHARAGHVFDCHTNPMRDESGAIAGGMTLLYETTEQRALQRQLLDSEARLSSVIESAGDAVWSLDREGRVTVYNTRFAADMLRTYGIHVSNGMRMFEALPGEVGRLAMENHQRCLRGESVTFESTAIVEGKPSHMLLSHNPIHAEGGIVGAVLMAKDITERREAELKNQRQSRTVELLQAIAATANEATSSDVAISRSLALVAEFAGWSVGHAFALSEGEFVSRGTWYLRDPAAFNGFREATEKWEFPPGAGLPGRVLATKRPAQMSTEAADADYPRASLARAHGLRTGFAFPVLVGEEIATVIEFFSERDERPGQDILELMVNVGMQLGRVIERERHAAAVRALSLTDELTGLHNRRGFMALAAQQLRTSARTKRPSVVLFADLDGLKRINDEKGHEAGDDAIAAFARVLRRTFRNGDIVSRLGGDEFVIVLDGSLSLASTAMLRLAHNLFDINASRPADAQIAASIGIIEVHPEDHEPLDAIVARADAAMYENKRARRGKAAAAARGAN